MRTAGFAVIASWAVVCFVLDRLSDYACDWWLDVCVHISKGLMMFYSAVIVVLAYNVYRLVTERGKTAAGLAGIELSKQMLVVMQGFVDKGKFYATNHAQLITDTQDGFAWLQEQGNAAMVSVLSEGGASAGGGEGVEMTSRKKSPGKMAPKSPRAKKID